MSWLSKELKRTTKILDPIGNQLRKSTGGSYGDPMNWYNSKPNTTKPWEPSQSPGLIAAPNGPTPPGQSFGQNTGGYSYIPNRFSGGVATPPPGAPNVPTPNVPGGAGAMSFGGGNMAPQVGMAPPQQVNPQMVNQMARIGAIRGSYV